MPICTIKWMRRNQLSSGGRGVAGGEMAGGEVAGGEVAGGSAMAGVVAGVSVMSADGAGFQRY
ncbi:MAG: hypothetical protein R2911_36765 [Caldilineaceae bacterium]